MNLIADCIAQYVSPLQIRHHIVKLPFIECENFLTHRSFGANSSSGDKYEQRADRKCFK